MKFTIFKRLTLGYLAIMLLVISLGVYVTLQLNQLNNLTHAIASVDGVTIRITENLLDAMFSQVSFEKKYLISKDQDFYIQFWQINEYFTEDVEKLECLVDTSEKKNLFAEAKELYDSHISIFKKEVGNNKEKK